MDTPELPFTTRLWFAWVCCIRVLYSGRFAASVFALSKGEGADRTLAEARGTRELEAASAAKSLSEPALASKAGEAAREGALQLLSLLQREGRFIDFVQQDITRFGDAEVGAAARVVHEGCRRALTSHAKIDAVRNEAEGSAIVVQSTEGNSIKLTGNLGGSAPYRGVLRHRGWRVEELQLPTLVGSPDLRVVAPAEVEL